MFSQHDWEKVTPDNVRETVKFDLLGDRKLQFTDEAVWWFTQDMLVVPLRSSIVTACRYRNKPIPYESITWVGHVTKRSPWALIFGDGPTMAGPGYGTRPKLRGPAWIEITPLR